MIRKPLLSAGTGCSSVRGAMLVCFAGTHLQPRGQESMSEAVVRSATCSQCYSAFVSTAIDLDAGSADTRWVGIGCVGLRIDPELVSRSRLGHYTRLSILQVPTQLGFLTVAARPSCGAC